MIRASAASWCGGCPGAATSSSPAWPTAAAASRCTGVAGAPRLTADDLQQWPTATRQYLTDNYAEVESETGVVPATDFISGDLYLTLWNEFVTAAASTANIDTGLGDHGVQPPPLAVQGSAPVSGLFSFDKYSSLPLLIDALRQDVQTSNGGDANRRLFLVPLAHVTRLHAPNT